MTNKDECLQLKNINYQTMLLNRKSNIDSDRDQTTNIDAYLSHEHEHIGGGKKPWNKLEKMTKIHKLNDYVDTLTNGNKISKEIKSNMKKYLRQCLERKKLQRIKDVTYDSNEGKIIKIPGFNFNKTTFKFTLRRIDKKSKISSSLAPKTKKNKSKTKNKKLRLSKHKSSKNKSGNRKKSPKTEKKKRKTSTKKETKKENKKENKKEK